MRLRKPEDEGAVATSDLSDEAPCSAVVDRVALAQWVEECCTERGHPAAAHGECHCGRIRYD